ncbi:MAG: hypothetical protein N4A47_07440 [Clostridia bacterium]|jgi:uncharacterized protein YkuJ|nr:hypothetical protein [Clostridia bacterium]
MNVSECIVGNKHVEGKLPECGTVCCGNQEVKSQIARNVKGVNKKIGKESSKVQGESKLVEEPKKVRNTHYDPNHNSYGTDKTEAKKAYDRAVVANDYAKAADIEKKNNITVEKAGVKKVKFSGDRETIRTGYIDSKDHPDYDEIDFMHAEALKLNQTNEIKEEKTEEEVYNQWLEEVNETAKEIEEEQKKEAEKADVEYLKDMEKFVTEDYYYEKYQDDIEVNSKKKKHIDMLSKKRSIRRALSLESDQGDEKAKKLMEKYGIKEEQIVLGKLISKGVVRRVFESLKAGDFETVSRIMNKYKNPEFIKTNTRATIRKEEENVFGNFPYEGILDIEASEKVISNEYELAKRMDLDKTNAAKEAENKKNEIISEEELAFEKNIAAYNEEYDKKLVAKYKNDPDNQRDPMEAITRPIYIKGMSIDEINEEFCS